MIKLIFCTSLILCLTTSSHAFDTNEAAPGKIDLKSPSNHGSAIVAKGKGFEVNERQMEQVIASRVAANPEAEFPPDTEARVLTHLIEIQLVLQKATEAEKTEARKKNDANFPDITKTMGDKFESQLKATGMTADELRQTLFEENAAQQSLTRQLGLQVSDAEAKKFFDEHAGAFDLPERLHIRELVLLTTTDWTRADASSLPRQAIEAKHKLMFDLHKRILAGEDFTGLARQYNEHPLSKANSDERTFVENQMEIGELAASMKTNEISGVVTNEGNFCIFQLLEIIPAKKAEFAEVAPRIKSILVGEKKRAMAPAYIRELWKEADVEILDPKLRMEIEKAKTRTENAEKVRAELVAKAKGPATNQAAATAEKKPAETIPNQEEIARIAAQYTNAPQHFRIPAPKPP